MSGSTVSAKPSPNTFRVIGRILEILIMVLLGAGIISLSYDPRYLIVAVLLAILAGVLAYCCALNAMPKKSEANEAEKPFSTEDRYIIDATNLEKMTAEGVPWDVVGALTALIDFQPSSSSGGKPKGMTEVELVRQLVSLRCDLERINEFRKKILKNTRVKNTIDPLDSSNPPSSDSASATRVSTLDPSPVVRTP